MVELIQGTSEPSLWVLATGRCGTMALTATLNTSPDIQACHDMKPLYWNTWPGGNPVDYQRRGRMLKVWANRKVYAEISNALTEAAEVILKTLPNSRFIFLHRDPRSTVLSGLRVGWFSTNPTIGDPSLRERPDRWPLDQQTAEQWDSMSRVQRCIWRWTAINWFSYQFTLQNPGRCWTMKNSVMAGEELTALFNLFDWLDVDRPKSSDLMKAISQRWNYPPLRDHLSAPDWQSEWDKWLPLEFMDNLGY